MKKIVICSTLTKECIHVLNRVSDELDISDSIFHIITLIKLQTVVIDLSPYIYPETIHYAVLKAEALKLISEIGNSLNIEPDKIVYKCFFEYDIKQSIKLYIEEVSGHSRYSGHQRKARYQRFFFQLHC